MRGNGGREYHPLFAVVLVLAAGMYVYEKIAAGDYAELLVTTALVAATVALVALAIQYYGRETT